MTDATRAPTTAPEFGSTLASLGLVTARHLARARQLGGDIDAAIATLGLLDKVTLADARAFHVAVATAPPVSDM